MEAKAMSARATEIKVLTARAIATVLGETGQEFEQQSGHRLNVESGFAPDFVQRIEAGEPFDILICPPPMIDGLIKNGVCQINSRA